jgi:hypothetical protein
MAKGQEKQQAVVKLTFVIGQVFSFVILTP